MLQIIAAAVLAAAGTAWAQGSPVGLWKTIDDDGKTEKSLIRITESGGVLTGKLEKLLDPTAKPDAVCDKCSDERKDQPVLGMVILRNARQDTDEKDTWTGGEILDPNNGKTYKVRLTPTDGGHKLEVRGFIGPFYRTQVWIRVE